jgi:hypothetical protein
MKVGGRIPITVSRPVIIQIMSGESNAIIDPDLYTAPMSILGKGWREINEVIVYQAHMSACRDRNGSDRVPMFLGVGLETFRDNSQHRHGSLQDGRAWGQGPHVGTLEKIYEVLLKAEAGLSRGRLSIIDSTCYVGNVNVSGFDKIVEVQTYRIL